LNESEYGKTPLPIPSAIQSGSDGMFGVKMSQSPLHFSMENQGSQALKVAIEGLGARTAQLKDLQYWENAKENLSAPTTFSGKNSTTHNDRGGKRGQE